MLYSEILPDNIFTHHIECYWHLSTIDSTDGDRIFNFLMPTCTFNILFTNQTCQIKTTELGKWETLHPGSTFLGQRNHCIQIKSKHPLSITGVRFKPFAFAKLIDTPIYKLNDSLVPTQLLFAINKTQDRLIQRISKLKNLASQELYLNDLMFTFFGNSFTIDEILRAQLNYIMNRKGSAKISELFEEFKISKVTLHKHFVNKVGLSPKRVSQIWRMNYFFELYHQQSKHRLTALCLDAGFYDQAHFIKEFKALFKIAPRKFFEENSAFVRVAHQNISKRFNNKYDPR